MKPMTWEQPVNWTLDDTESQVNLKRGAFKAIGKTAVIIGASEVQPLSSRNSAAIALQKPRKL